MYGAGPSGISSTNTKTSVNKTVNESCIKYASQCLVHESKSETCCPTGLVSGHQTPAALCPITVGESGIVTR